MVKLKARLIEEINKIDDTSLLQQISDLVLESDQEVVVEFNSTQIKDIKDSQNQIQEGDSFDHIDVMKMINE